MKDEDKTKEQLINKLAELRQRITRLEASEAELKRVREVRYGDTCLAFYCREEVSGA